MLPSYQLTILKPLATGPNTGSTAESINNDGGVVGSSSVPTKPGYTGARGTRWTTPTDVVNMGFLLADINGYTIVTALDVNSPGLAVGYAWDIEPRRLPARRKCCLLATERHHALAPAAAYRPRRRRQFVCHRRQ